MWGKPHQWGDLEIIDFQPVFMSLEEQTELFAQQIKKLGRFQFLLRPAIAEGHIGSAALPLTILDLDRDKATGEHQFPEAPLLHRLRAALAKHAGIPIARLLQEQETRVPQALPEQAVRLIPSQPRQTRSQPNGHQAAQRARAIPVAPGGNDSKLPQRRDAQPEQAQQKEPATPGTNQIPRSGAKGRRRHRVS